MEYAVDSNKLSESSQAKVEELKNRHLEMERELHRERTRATEHMTKEEHKEIQSQKRRKDGMETIAKLFHETQQDFVGVLKKNKTLELSVRYLQNRLIQNGLNPDVELEDGDVFIPGPSKEVMDNLVRENSRLRSITRSHGDPDELQQVRQALQTSEYEVETLRSENSELREQCKIAEAAGKQLAEQIKEQEHLHKTSSEESANLRKQLTAVSLTCHEMACKMELANSESNKSPVQAGQMSMQNLAELSRLREENKHLNGSVANLHSMNQRWKNYNDQREVYIRDLQVQLQTARGGHLEEETVKKYEAILTASRKELQGAMTEKSMLESQVTRLNQEMETLQEAFSAQGEELRRASQQVEDFTLQGMPSGHDIEALKTQIQICTEDFECERKDREKAQDRYNQAEQDNQNLRRQINQLQKELQGYGASVSTNTRGQFQSMNLPSPNVAKPPRFGRDPMTMLNIEPDVRLNARGARVSQRQVEGLVGGDVTDSQPNLAEDGVTSAALVSRGSSEKTGRASAPVPRKLIQEIGLLQCPKCRKEYEAYEHNELLEHIEICC